MSTHGNIAKENLIADYITCKVFYTLAQQATIQILNFPCVFEVKCWIPGHYMQWRTWAMRARAMEILRLARDFHSLCYRLGISYAKPNGIGFARDSHKHINTPFRCCTMRDDFDLHFPQNYTFRNVTNTMCIVYCVLCMAYGYVVFAPNKSYRRKWNQSFSHATVHVFPAHIQ